MPDFIIFMHGDMTAPSEERGWPEYLAGLRAKGVFEGGSSIGQGRCARKAGAPAPLSKSLNGYIRVSAPNLDAAQALIAGNPVYEAGGTVEIRELPRDD